MARERLSEFRAKHLLAAALGEAYQGIQLLSETDWRAPLAGLNTQKHYVAKVDQAVGGRFKQGLVLLSLPAAKVPAAVSELFGRGYRSVLVEPFTPHPAAAEHYLAIKRQRSGESIMFSTKGGVEIESQPGGIPAHNLTPATIAAAERSLGLANGTVHALHKLFNAGHFTLLEINPLITNDHHLVPLDLVVEIDAAAENFVGGAWTAADLRHADTTPEEAAVAELAERSPASFNLKALNPSGQIFALLSGGGASLVIVDEICHQGFGPLLGNFGEYSGDPSEDETYSYVTQVLQQLLQSEAKTKVLVIGGGVANFTDVHTTFQGIIRALEAQKTKLRTSGVKVYVRRGGPNAAAGLAAIRQFLQREQLLGLVAGPELNLAELVAAATATLTPVTA